MKKIPLGSNLYPGLFALVDDEDYEHLNKLAWHPQHVADKQTMWASNTYTNEEGKKSSRTMHRYLLELGKGQKGGGVQVDHHDGNGLNNQRSNLRLCTHQQNMQNRGVCRNNKLGVKGVCKFWGKYLAQIGVNNKIIRIGCYATLEEAAAAYKKAAKKYHGNFSRSE